MLPDSDRCKVGGKQGRSGGEEKVMCVQTGDYTGNGQGDAVEGACYLAQASATSSVLSFKKSERFRE